MQVESQLSPVLIINAPEWFVEDAFTEWLNNDDHKMVWHIKGQAPDEFASVVTFVDPSLSGEGSDQFEMPDQYWNQIVDLCRKHFKPTQGFHIVVRITNYPE